MTTKQRKKVEEHGKARVDHVKTEGELKLRFEDFMKTNERSANWTLQKALEAFLPKTK